MVGNTCRKQFTRRNFGFRCKEEEKNLFYRSQWNESRVIFLVYRTFICLYSLGWVLAWYIIYGIYEYGRLGTAYRYFTVWAEAGNAIYFSLAFVLSAVGAARRRRSNRMEHGAIKLLRSMTWMFFDLAITIQIIMLVMFWGLLVPNLTVEFHPTPFYYHQHLVTVVLILIDIFVVAFPIRLLHFIYPVLGGVIYISMTLILHATGVTSAVYPFLNWAGSPGIAAGISAGLCLPGVMLLQCVVFGLYCLRLQIHKCVCGSRDARRRQSSSTTRDVQGVKIQPVENDNPVFNVTGSIPQGQLPQASDYF